MSTVPAVTSKPTPFLHRYRRVLREGTWVAVGQAVSAVALLVGTRLITRVIAPKVYGLASLLIAGEVFARSVFCSPLLNAGIRFYPEAERIGKVAKVRAILSHAMTRNVAFLFPIVLIGAWWYLRQDALRTAIACALGVFFIVDVARSLEMSMLSGARGKPGRRLPR